MNEDPIKNSFSAGDRAILHSVVEMLNTVEKRDQLRDLLRQGVTIAELVTAYRTQKRIVSILKAMAGLAILLGAAVSALKGLGLWPAR